MLCISCIRSWEPDSLRSQGKGAVGDQEHTGVSHSGLLCRRPPLYLLRSCKTRLPLGRVSWRRQQLRPESAVLRASQAPSTALPIQCDPCSFLEPTLSHRRLVCLPGKPHTPRPHQALGPVLGCLLGYSKEGTIS